jgi:outer membrane protein assembly factor BamB
MPLSDKNKPRFASNETLWRTAMTVAVIAGLFSLAVSTMLIANYVQVQAVNPLDNPEIIKLRLQLAQSQEPNPALAEQIRVLDLLARKAFFTSQKQLQLGGYLLLGGAVTLVLALYLAAQSRPRLPLPDPKVPVPGYWTLRARARELIALAGFAWVLCALLAAYATRLDVPVPTATASLGAPASLPASEEQQKTQASPAPAVTWPDWAAVGKNWPSFRGPGSYGVAQFTTAPVEWDVESGKNIKWKTDVPMPSPNSPVVWGNRIFMSGATEEKREIYCYDTESGQLLWTHVLEKLPGTPDTPPKISEETGFAAATMAVHGDRACAIFANGDLACVDFEGKLLWGKNLGVPENHYGHSSSLIAFANLLLVQYDSKANGRLIALDLSDGKEVYTTKRGIISWSSPSCVETPAGFQLVLNSSKDVTSYDPLTGTQLWQLKCLSGEVAPSPAWGAGMFFVANDYATATAIKFAEGKTPPEPEIAWEYEDALPDTSSPVGTDTHFYISTARGEIVCLDAKTGAQAWLQETEEGFQASPIVVGDRVYLVDRKGVMHIFKDSAAFETMGSPALGGETFATPAFLDGRIYARTVTQLICIAAG